MFAYANIMNIQVKK